MSTEEENKIRRTSIGDLLQENRLRKGLSRDEVAAALNFDSGHSVQIWENGLSLPSVEVLPKLVKILGIDESSLMKAIMDCQEKLHKLKRDRIKSLIK